MNDFMIAGLLQWLQLFRAILVKQLKQVKISLGAFSETKTFLYQLCQLLGFNMVKIADNSNWAWSIIFVSQSLCIEKYQVQ